MTLPFDPPTSPVSEPTLRSGAGDQPADAQPLNLAAGEHFTLPAGQVWGLHAGLMGLDNGPAPACGPMAVFGPGTCLAPAQALKVWALQPLVLRPLAGLSAPDWRAQARALQWLQWQSAQWAWCCCQHTPVARAASWTLLATASAGAAAPGLGDAAVQGAHGPLAGPSAVLHGLPPGHRARALQWQRAAWQPVASAVSAARGSAQMQGGGRARARSASHMHDVQDPVADPLARGRDDLAPDLAPERVLGHLPALRRLACGCHRQLLGALQASASASATLMPSTPADKMPPA